MRKCFESFKTFVRLTLFKYSFIILLRVITINLKNA